MSTVIDSKGRAKAVKNLGWLLRHWRDVEWLGFNYAPNSVTATDGELVARLRDGGVYITAYASLSVCWSWLNRPIFQGLQFRLVKREKDTDSRRDYVIGSPDWKRINKLS